MRLIARQRQQLGGMLAVEKNRLHKILTAAGIRLNVLVADRHGQVGRAMVKAIIATEPPAEILMHSGRLKASRQERFEARQAEDLSPTHRFVLAEMLSYSEELQAGMQRFERQLLNGLAPWQSLLVLLQTVPGIDPIGAALVLVEFGTEMAAFGSAERLASWVGICPGNHESAGKRHCGKTRRGNAWVRRLLCAFAQAAARRRCVWRDQFTTLKFRKGHKNAIVALGHKLLRLNYAILSRHTPYQDRTVDDEALMVQRNAPR